MFYTRHAKDRMRERFIDEETVKKVIAIGTSEPSTKSRKTTIFRWLCYMVAYDVEMDTVVTVSRKEPFIPKVQFGSREWRKNLEASLKGK